MDDQRVIIERDGAIAHVRLNRPDKHNGMNEAMLDAVIAAGRDLEADRELRGVLLSGNGPSFCAGLDVSAMLGSRSTALRLSAELLKPWANRFQHWGLVWRRLPVPVIACVHGSCLGAGMQLALAADLRIARPDASLSIMETRWGLVPDMTGMLTLPELLPLDAAKDLVFSARVLDGEQAHALGLVTQLAEDPIGRAGELLAEYADRSPDAIGAAKQLLHRAYGPGEGRVLAAERRAQLGIIGRENQRIAIGRNRASRQAGPITRFKPRKR